MTKILIDLATAEQTLEALDSENPDIQLKAALALRTVLEQQQAKPVQEPTPWRDMVVVSLVREGINKHRARELADHFAAQPEQEPVGEVTEVSDNGFRCEFNRRLAVGTKLYIAPPMPVQEDAFEGWVKIDELREHFNAVNCGTIYRHAGEGRVLLRATPPKREWQGLTDEEIENAISDGFARGLDDGNVPNQAVIHYVRVIEAALKEKNHD